MSNLVQNCPICVDSDVLGASGPFKLKMDLFSIEIINSETVENSELVL